MSYSLKVTYKGKTIIAGVESGLLTMCISSLKGKCMFSLWSIEAILKERRVWFTPEIMDDEVVVEVVDTDKFSSPVNKESHIEIRYRLSPLEEYKLLKKELEAKRLL